MEKFHKIFIPNEYQNKIDKYERSEKNINHIKHVKEGEIIWEVKEEKYFGGQVLPILSPHDGYFVPNPPDFSYLYLDSPIGFISETLEDALSLLYRNNPTLENDRFTGNQSIKWLDSPVIENWKWENYFCFNSDYMTKFVFSFEYNENEGKIFFKLNDMKVSKGDAISLLFENGKILDFPICEKPISDVIKCTLYQDDIDEFMKSPIDLFRITFNKEGKNSITMERTKFYGQYFFEAQKVYVERYLNALKELVPDYKLPMRKIQKELADYKFNWCYVYLMKDMSNGYHKIGISNKPEYRERTLQSEKPSIEMLACKKFPSRKIAEAIESALHTAYSQQRIRGEWFDLNNMDVAAIIETLK